MPDTDGAWPWSNTWQKQGLVLSDSLYGAAQEPTVLYEKNPQILTDQTYVFKMWYRAGWKNPTVIRYSESKDGQNWTMSETVLSPGYDMACPTVIFYNSVYYLYTSVGVRLERFSSSNGIAWTLDSSDVISLGSAGNWDSGWFGNVYVWINGPNDWKMLYEASAPSTNGNIGYASSTNGITWTKFSGNPVLTTPTGCAGGPWFAKWGQTYYCWFHSSDSLGWSLPTDIYLAKSSNLVSWTWYSQSPVLARTYPWEGAKIHVGGKVLDNPQGQVADPTLLQVGNTAYLYYTANPDQTGEQAAKGGGVALAIQHA